MASPEYPRFLGDASDMRKKSRNHGQNVKKTDCRADWRGKTQNCPKNRQKLKKWAKRA
jgi:hypothetical protein